MLRCWQSWEKITEILLKINLKKFLNKMNPPDSSTMPGSEKYVEIDGSYLEGGGQILRISLTLSAIKKIPVRIYNIRGNRSKPGLMEQHLKGVELLAEICSAKVDGMWIGSTEVTFCPGEIKGGSFLAHVRTAGSISLLLQLVLPCSLFSKTPTTLTLRGGTNAEMAPQIDYTTEVFKPILEKFGATFDFDLVRRGYFPAGNGEVIVKVWPVEKLHPVELIERGNTRSIVGWSFVAGNVPENVSHQMANSARDLMRNCPQPDIMRYKEDPSIAPNNCAGILLVAETDTKCILGSSALRRKNENAADTGKRVADELNEELKGGGCVDKYSQDQIIILMALAKGTSRIRVGKITLHTETAMYIVKKLTNVNITVQPSMGGTNILECHGS